uniref:XK-related protein n=1 Tax=Crassostrea virginica TaxID=6565 RepID=A0A8B8EW46_CRAVI|nr:uncharacterized protein LOC111137171 isoform X2 [Crassostrea virginica]
MMKKKSTEKRNSSDGKDEVDNMVGFRGNLQEKGSLITSNSHLDVVDGGATQTNEENERDQPKNGFKNTMGNRDEDELDNTVGSRGNLQEKKSLSNENETSNSDQDVVDGGVTLTKEENERDQPKNGFKNTMGNRDEDAKSIDGNGEQHTDDSQPYPFRWLNAVGAVMSTVFFLVDVVTDILLAVEYNDHGRILECALTSSVVIASFLVAGILSTIWFVQDSKGPKNSVKNVLFLVLAFPFSTLIRGVFSAFAN